MTVAYADKEESGLITYLCDWHDPQGKTQSDEYYEDQLRAFDPVQPDAHSLYIGPQAANAGAPDPAAAAKDWRDKHGIR
jgi:hypothetical protein